MPQNPLAAFSNATAPQATERPTQPLSEWLETATPEQRAMRKAELEASVAARQPEVDKIRAEIAGREAAKKARAQAPPGRQSAPRPANPLATFASANAGPETPQAPESQEGRSALGYAAETVGNIPGSAGRAIADLASALWNPLDTAGAIGGAVAGGGQLLGDQIGIPDTGLLADHRDKARAVGEFYSDRYGGGQETLDTIREDPFGAALDIGGVLTGGAGLAARAPGAAGRIGRAVLDADPTGKAINAAGQAVRDRLPTTPSNREFIADAPTPETLRGQAGALYREADASGVKFKADYYDSFVDTALSRMV